MRRHLTLLPVLALAAVVATASPGWARALTGDFQLSTPAVTTSGDRLILRGAVCRAAVAGPGAPIVAVSHRDAQDHETGVSPVRLVGATRGRAGGCATYVAHESRARGERVAICVSSPLSPRQRQCVPAPLPTF